MLKRLKTLEIKGWGYIITSGQSIMRVNFRSKKIKPIKNDQKMIMKEKIGPRLFLQNL